MIELAIMFPMITTLEEVRRVRRIFTSVQQELEREDYFCTSLFGIMIETPAAALMANVLAREVDFFSIGANDLAQYTLAADRTNSQVMSMFGMLEPAVWRSIAMIAQAGLARGKLVAVCGELAADPYISPLLAGLGVKELSMNPSSMMNVKAALHERPMAFWQQKARELLEAETAAEILALLSPQKKSSGA
jgi:phosphoenolpyruvate-protein kinase (PTS system EI component)